MYKPLSENEGEQRSCIQKYISWTSYINLIISLVALGFGIYKFIQNESAWEGTQYDWNRTFLVLLIIGASLLLISSITGIIGGRKRNKCCIFFYTIFSMFLALAFLAIGFTFLGITDAHIANIQDSDCIRGDDGTQIFVYGQEAYNTANTLLCTDKCHCNITKQNIIDYIKNDIRLIAKLPYIDSVNGYSKVQDCPTYDQVFTDQNIRDQANWLRSLEDSFSCTGMCTKPANLYFFSDINHGIPDNDTCKLKFENFVSSYGKVIYVVGLIVGFYLLLNTILSCFLCCQRKQTGQTYYDRFSNF